jgi:hypothetical protein
MDRCPNCGYERAIKEGVKPKTYGYAKLQYDLRKLVVELREEAYKPNRRSGNSFEALRLADRIEKLLEDK